MLEILEKTESEVTCIIDDKQYHYQKGKDAYHQLLNKYSIISIKAVNNQIIISLELKESSKDKDWQEDYKKQFGQGPSFF